MSGNDFNGVSGDYPCWCAGCVRCRPRRQDRESGAGWCLIPDRRPRRRSSQQSGQGCPCRQFGEFVATYIDQGRHREPPVTAERAESVWESLRHVREAGYSVDNEDVSIGIRCLGAAICGVGSRRLFAVSITGLSPRVTLEACAQRVPTLLSGNGQLSQQFGCDIGIVNRAIARRAWNAA